MIFYLHNYLLLRPSSSTPSMSCIIGTSQWARWRLKSPASRLFAQPFVRAQIIRNIKAPRHWPLWGESTSQRACKASVTSNHGPYDFLHSYNFSPVRPNEAPVGILRRCCSRGHIRQRERLETAVHLVWSNNSHDFAGTPCDARMGAVSGRTILFKIAGEYVCERVAILSRIRWVKERTITKNR